MTTVHVWVDELGTVDYNDTQQPLFGFGSVSSTEPLAELAAAAEKLKYRLALEDNDMSKGFHCREDSYTTRKEFFPLVRENVQDFNATLLFKKNAYDYVQQKGQMHLYKQAWYLHVKYLVGRYNADKIHIIVATFGTAKRAKAAKEAIHEVCNQFDVGITTSVWDAHSTVGLQAADYCLWATYQKIKGKNLEWHKRHVEPITSRPVFYPWGATKRQGP